MAEKKTETPKQAGKVKMYYADGKTVKEFTATEAGKLNKEKWSNKPWG